jgi:thioredoxin 1
MRTRITTLTDATFDEEVGASVPPVVVDFWAPWCGPCAMLEPVLEELAEEHAPTVRFARLNVDEEPGVAARFGVMSMPTLIVFRDGEPVGRLIGARGAGRLRQDLADLGVL